MDEDEWEDVDEIEMIGPLDPPALEVIHRGRRKSSLICPIYNVIIYEIFYTPCIIL